MLMSGTKKWKTGRWALAALLTGTLAAGMLSGCAGEDQVPSVGYAFDGLITTYNSNTAVGSASGAAVAFSRVLPGFFYTGPDGQPVADTDVGTAKEVPGEALTIQYRLDNEGTYSDGLPTTCDDLVLEWAARSGRFTKADDSGQPVPLFDAASTAGYSDIDQVQCQPGSRDATVVFRPGRGFTQWRTLFGAGALMPSHIAGKAANVPDLVQAVRTGDRAALGRIADFWNGWQLTPGKLDLALLPSAGPYRIESYDSTAGLVLVANERWSGPKPATPRIVLWPKNTDLKAKLSQQAVGVIDIGAGAIPGLDLGNFTAHNEPGLATEQLTLAITGVFGAEAARRAFALCVPRQRLYDQLGHPGYTRPAGLGAGVVNSRITAPDSLNYPAAAAEGVKLPGGDVAAAQAALASGPRTFTVRVGYTGPDERRHATVAAIAEACNPAGITVIDSATADFDPRALRDGKVDAILGGPGSAAGAPETAAGLTGRYALRGGSGANFGGYANARYDGAVDQLAVAADPGAVLNATADAERLLWSDLPTIPLFSQPRTIAFLKGLHNAVPSASAAGSGWNMDRWVLTR